MHHLKTVAIASLFVLLIGCRPDAKIKRLQEEVARQEQEVATLQDSLTTVTDSIELVERIRREQLQRSEAIQDSVHDYIMESPVATAYIKTYDRQPIEIVNDFFQADNEDAQQILLLYHVVLQIYANDPDNMRTVAMVRQGLFDFNQRKEQADAYAENASYWKSRYEASAEQKRRRLELLKNELSTTKEELEAAENEGLF
ncbi:MAG TPA: hypothetical protein VK183_02325 [Flavobacterium sp.]|nr:hypothetical protein [Flavobacterium sp.]